MAKKLTLPNGHNCVLPLDVIEDLKNGCGFELSWDEDEQAIVAVLVWGEPSEYTVNSGKL